MTRRQRLRSRKWAAKLLRRVKVPAAHGVWVETGSGFWLTAVGEPTWYADRKGKRVGRRHYLNQDKRWAHFDRVWADVQDFRAANPWPDPPAQPHRFAGEVL